jgi:DNA-binding PadR family transcriptional regulator
VIVSKVDVVVLGLLSEGPRYGYDLLEQARDRGMGSWAEVGRASVYQALHRLATRGLIAGRDQAGTEGPDRRVYRITRAGRTRLREGLAERFGDPGPYETEAGLAMGFLHLLSAADARRAIDAREQAVRGLLEDIGEARALAEDAAAGSRTQALAMLDRQEALAGAELTWIGRLRASRAGPVGGGS